MSAISTDQLTAFFKAAGDQLRLGILRVLRHESYGVQELTYIFDMLQSGMSHHLKILAKANLLTTRREGTRIFYRRTLLQEGDPILQLKKGLFAAVDGLDIATEHQTRMAEVREERARSSREFFAKNANRFREKQDLIVTYPQYEGSLNDLLASITLPTQSQALEVGPGSGELLANLTRRYDQVFALDHSREMLEQTQTLLEDKGIQSVRYIQDDPAGMAKTGMDVDLVVLNMVLHHMASPAAEVAIIADMVRPGGALLIADLCPHDQIQVRETCGDMWLGFEPQDLTTWALDAGLVEGQSVYVGLKNGFQVQIRLFLKEEDFPAERP